MENKLQLFEYLGQEVRVLEIDRAIWFIASDVGRVLELKNIRQNVADLDDDEKLLYPIHTGGQSREVQIISEPGFYKVIGHSRTEPAKAFDRWVRHEVLPALRKTGSYSMNGKTSEEQLADELSMLNFVESGIDTISKAICQPWIVEDPERVFYGKAAMDYMRLEVGRANHGYTKVAQYFHGKHVFVGFDARGRLTKFQMDIRNGKVAETQMHMPFGSGK